MTYLHYPNDIVEGLPKLRIEFALKVDWQLNQITIENVDAMY